MCVLAKKKFSVKILSRMVCKNWRNQNIKQKAYMWVWLLVNNVNIFKYSFNLIYMYYCFPCMYVGVPHACSVHRGQKRESDSLELELHRVESCYMTLIIKRSFSLRAASVLNRTVEPSFQLHQCYPLVYKSMLASVSTKDEILFVLISHISHIFSPKENVSYE